MLWMIIWYPTNGSFFVDTSPAYVPEPSKSKRKYSTMDGKVTPLTSDKLHSQPNQKRMQKQTEKDSAFINGRSPVSPPKHIIQSSSEESSSDDDVSEDLLPKGKIQKASTAEKSKVQKASTAEKSFENENGDTTSNRKASPHTRASASKIKVVNTITFISFCFHSRFLS